MPYEPEGKYKGARDPRCDYFDDIMGSVEEAGIFNTDHPAEGIRDFENVQVQREREGIRANVPMRHQSGRADLLITWGELYVIAEAPKTGVLPQGWSRSEVNRAAYPDVYPPLMVAPDWAQNQLKRAVNDGLLHQADLESDPNVQMLGRFLQQHGAQQ